MAKQPDMNALNALSKAPITDPIITGTPVSTGTTGNTGSTGTPVTPGTTGRTASAGTTKSKLTVQLPVDLHGRIRAVWFAAAHIEHIGSVSEWATIQLEKAVETYESRYNNGVPFTPIGPGVLPNFSIN
ncbi:hypothetical protein [Actinotignum urinale]|uniref:hypothetical protein n=1 Tax=Actinotignum urinale TaxID=190146 RepID=UPI0003B6D969|nr:hypothetical protein [Actinotignum urinale]MDY5129801.1 hypothetical protein [Actinotignum urinale]MDY5160976.1 hypothetical protein [Actinotignum urinale]